MLARVLEGDKIPVVRRWRSPERRREIKFKRERIGSRATRIPSKYRDRLLTRIKTIRKAIPTSAGRAGWPARGNAAGMRRRSLAAQAVAPGAEESATRLLSPRGLQADRADGGKPEGIVLEQQQQAVLNISEATAPA